jgi:hypothetical protein
VPIGLTAGKHLPTWAVDTNSSIGPLAERIADTAPKCFNQAPRGIGTLGKKRDQAMNLLKVASHFSSELALGIRQFGAECDLASWVSQRHSPSQCQRRLPLRRVQLNHTDE